MSLTTEIQSDVEIKLTKKGENQMMLERGSLAYQCMPKGVGLGQIVSSKLIHEFFSVRLNPQTLKVDESNGQKLIV